MAQIKLAHSLSATVATVLVFGSFAFAQIPDFKPQEQKAQIAKLSFLHGKWKGKGWSEMVPGQKELVDSTEEVSLVAGGTCLFVIGKHWREGKMSDSTQLVHDAAATITYDPKTSGYVFRSQLATGAAGVRALTVSERSFSWVIEMGPQGRIVYTMKLTDAGEWFEYGEWFREGVPTRRIMEMKLKRVDAL